MNKKAGHDKKKVAVIFEVMPTAEMKVEYFKLGAALKEEL